MEESPNISRYLHLPLQSGSDKVLTKMMRRYFREDYLKIIERARDLMPDATITTDIIVGFPGETKEDFRQTLKTVKSARFDLAYMFAYSKREGTLASLFPDQVKDSIKKERLQLLIKTQNEITKAKAEELIGKELSVLAIETKNGRIIMLPGVAKIGFEYIINIYKINGWVPVGKIKKEAKK
jgi:tRNA-2-methylthio-N6-dimethylallyladenosine synthase